MKKYVLVTGGAGFIGSHLLDLLAADSRYNLIVVDNLSSGDRNNLPEGVELFEMDIRDASLASVFTRFEIDTVVHLAAQTMVNISMENPREDADINICGAINLLQNMLKHNVKNIVFASSAAVYGDVSALPVVEEAPTAPTSFYGLSKLTWERYLGVYARAYGIQASVLRFANVYGPRQGDGGEGGVVSIFGKCLRNHQPLKVYGDGTQTRDFVYVGDVARAIAQCIKEPCAYRIMNVSTNTEVSVLELIATIERVLNRKVEVVFTAVRTGDIYRSVLDNSKMVALGISPEASLYTGVKNTLEYMLK